MTGPDGDPPEDQSGPMGASYGRILRTSDRAKPYTAILTHDQCAETQRAFATMEEAEAFIRRHTPQPRPRSTFWDRDAPEV